MNQTLVAIRQIIARVDKKGNVIGEIERWEAHKKGILHRAFTVALIYKNYYILQHRKHPAFDGLYDITSSSHQLYSNGKLEGTIEAAKRTLFREWKIKESDIVGELKINGAIYYKSRDPKSVWTEHEFCDIVEVRVNKIPEPNYKVAYGVSLATKKELSNKKGNIYHLFAPWVKKMIEKGLL